MKKTILLALLTIALTASARVRTFTLASPDGQLVSTIRTDKGGIFYDLRLDGRLILEPSEIGLVMMDGKGNCEAETMKPQTVDGVVPSPFSGQDTLYNRCNELYLRLRNGLIVIFRAYNEGFAYHFRAGNVCTVKSETVKYRFAEDWNLTAAYTRHFNPTDENVQYGTSFENTYTTLPLSQLDLHHPVFLPVLVDAGVAKIALTESYLENFPGLYLKGTGTRTVVGDQPRVPDSVYQGGHNMLQERVVTRKDHIATLKKGDETPWRILMVARTDAELASNNLTYLLGAPCRMPDYSWVKPGKVAWDWWNWWNISGVDFEAGINNDTYKYYIDFAAKYGIEYVILDEGWAVTLQADLFQVVPDIDLPMLAQYAEERGVRLILWAGYYAFQRDMERVCRHYSEMGIKGFKVDFMDRDDALMNRFYYEAAAMCAKYHLVVDFHGAHMPAGINRTYPNVLNFEGVFGLENLKGSASSHDQISYDLQIPFIRALGGPMDYTPGAMRNGAKGFYQPIWCEPMSQGTRCHQLALYLVLDQPLAMLCDAPSDYMREPEYTRLLASIPTVWDETRILQAKYGHYIVTARRKGDVWYVGGITDWTARDIEIDLSALTNGPYKITMCLDGKNAHRKASDYKLSMNQLFHENSFKVHLAPGGGFFLRLESTK